MSDIVEGVAAAQLKSIVERIERLEEEIKSINDDKSDVYAEAKGNGYDVKALKKVVAARRMSQGDREALETTVELYRNALGMA